MELVLKCLFLGSLTVTSYRSVKNQTDDTPFNTSTGEHVSISGVAVSQDLLCGACKKLHRRCKHPEVLTKLHYGDCLYISDVGFRIINDTMGLVKHEKIKTRNGFKRIYTKQHDWLDIWVSSYKEEHQFHRRFGVSKHKVWLVKEEK